MFAACFPNSVSLTKCLPCNLINEIKKQFIDEQTKRSLILKKASRLRIPLIFLDESGFSMSPIRGAVWAEVGKPMVLQEVYSRCSQTGLGFMMMTPRQSRLNFRFTIFDGAMNTQDRIFFLTMIHRHDSKKVMMEMDCLLAHLFASKYFEREYSDEFEFVYLPSYYPELNSVELCWNYMKHVLMSNFVSLSLSHLEVKTLEAAQVINKNPKVIKKFCIHAKRNL